MNNVKGTLYLNMIVAENEPVEMVTRGIDTVKDYVDGMYITVTYKDQKPETSPLIETLTSYGAQVSFFHWIDDFAAARQFALDQVPKDKDVYIYWQDADDVLDGAEYLREALNTAIQWQWAGVFFPYLYRVELDESGNIKEILVRQERERIIRNDGTYQWKGMLHETLIGVRIENLQQRKFDKCTVIHLTDEERVNIALDRNIQILEKQLQLEQARDPRTLVYLAKAYYDMGNEVLRRVPIEEREALITEQDAWFDKAIMLFNQYLHGFEQNEKEVEGSGWPEERATAWQYLSQILLLRKEFGAALASIDNAIDESPTFPQYYIDKAVIYTHMEDWEKARHWLTVGTKIEIPETTLMIAPRDMKVRALECDAHIAMHDQDLQRVADDYTKLLTIAPNNDVYTQNLLAAQSIQAANQASQSIVFLAKYLSKIGEEGKILPLLQAVPQELQRESFYAQMIHAHIPPRMWDKDEIAILCGPGFEQWSPKSIEKGLGGSEEAVVYLAKELAAQGWKVTVYANPEFDEGDFDGVKYENYYKLNPQDYFNHLILWRGIGFADIKPQVQGKVILWLHDMPNLPDFTEERLKYIDKIAVLSDYHRQQIKMAKADNTFVEIPDAKFFLTRNGIPDLGVTTWEGDPHRVCYVSSPDRGLMYLLRHWKEVKDAVPDATLHVYYGFDIYDFIHRNNPSKMKFKEKIMKLMDQDGITYHGRIGHQELAEEMNKCGVWAYPTDFCVTGDTLVDMPRNYLTHPAGVPIKELVGKTNIPTWTFNESIGDFELKNIQWIKKTREKAAVIKVNWTDGTSLTCTPDHKILTYGRDWVEAKDLQIGESVVALKKHMQIEVSVGKGHWQTEHRLIAQNTLGPIPEGYHVDHIDGNPFNNSPENFQYLSPVEHAKKTFTGNKRTKQARKKQGEAYRLYAKTEEGKESLKQRGSQRSQKFWDNLSTEERQLFIASREQKRQQALQQVSWNHKVASIEDAGYEDVYDMLVEDNHNFIAGGVVIHNCEISCISAMKAQAVGAVPVVTNFAALQETVRNGIKVDVDIQDKDGQKMYFEALIDTLKDKKKQQELRNIAWAQSYFSWKNVGTQWSELLRGNVSMPIVMSPKEWETALKKQKKQKGGK